MNISPSSSQSFPRPSESQSRPEAALSPVAPPTQPSPDGASSTEAPGLDGRVLNPAPYRLDSSVDQGGGLFFQGEVVLRALRSIAQGLGLRRSSPPPTTPSDDPLDGQRLELRELDRKAVERATRAEVSREPANGTE